MATKKKLLQAAAGSAGGAALNVEDVFSTYLYEGNGSTQTITNGIDLDGEGGAILTKRRDSSSGGGPWFNDTERGITKYISTSDTGTGGDSSSSISAVTSSGYTLGGAFSGWNNSSGEYASWTFRKAPKFFDVVKYVGDRTQNPQNTLTLNHNLGSTPGMIIVKCLDDAQSWAVYHRTLTTGNNVFLNLTTASGNYNDFPSDPTSTTFTVGSDSRVNFTGRNYVAYLFAHNDGDGNFGPDGDQDIIKCGSYTPDGSGNATINLGFEPQFLLIKCSSAGGTYRGWGMFDAMRGVPTGSFTSLIQAHLSDAENQWFPNPRFTPTGFETTSADQADTVNSGGSTYIYIAIRRGPMAVPTDATDVFAQQDPGYPVDSNGLAFTSGFPVDLALLKERTNSTDGWYTMSRLQGNGNYMKTNSSASETSGVSYGTFDHNTGWFSTANASMSWMWKRAPSFCDVVAYTGNGTAGRTVSHNLGVAPEMIWVKGRNLSSQDWAVYHSATGTSKYLKLNETNAALGIGRITGTSDTTFTLDSDDIVNKSGDPYIAYLFASLDGVSKVGSYTGNGSTQNIDCGFSARFVLIKCSSHSLTDWHVMDSTRGIVAGNDPWLMLNDTAEEDTGEDIIDPYSSGFALPANNRVNTSGRTYIFYAIA